MMEPDDDYEEDEADRREREENEAEDAAMENDPYSDEEKEQMGSSEFFFDND